MKNNKLVSTALVATAFTAIAALPACAQVSANVNVSAQIPGQQWGQGGQREGGMREGMQGSAKGMAPGIFGTVSAVSGTSLTVTGKQGFGPTSATTTYTVDASNSTVRKDNATSTVSSIAVGDTVMVRGTVSGTSITATSIFDGVMMRGGQGMGMMGGKGRDGMASSTSPVTGNGQPVIAGTISAISGSSITITNKSNVSYTVDASNAKIVQGQNTIAISNLAVGTSVIVQGSVNGKSVTATSIIDQAQPANNGTNGQPNKDARPAGFFGGIGQFFMHLFGF